MIARLITATVIVIGLAGCERAQTGSLQGYVEGESVIVSAPQGGWISELSIVRGQRVKAGDALFALDADAQVADRNRAAANVAQAEAQLANLGKGRRPDELAAIQAAIAEAEAAARFAESDLARLTALFAKGFATVKAVQATRANAEAARARVTSAKSQLATAKLGARSDEVLASQSAVNAARAQLAQVEYVLSQRQIRSRVDGLVEEVLREKGEFAPANGAVLQILPPGGIKIRFFVPEAVRSRVRVGDNISVNCTGCPAGLTAKINFISASAEFTPPIIYSEQARGKLVWMVEGRPDTTQVTLSPGQPVDVFLPNAVTQ